MKLVILFLSLLCLFSWAFIFGLLAQIKDLNRQVTYFRSEGILNWLRATTYFKYWREQAPLDSHLIGDDEI